MIRIERPSYAVNDPRVSFKGQVGALSITSLQRIVLEKTFDLPHPPEKVDRRLIIDRVTGAAICAPRGVLENVVLNCHGSSGTLELGQGFDLRHLALFAAWRGRVRKIWLHACAVASDAAGRRFCSGLARTVGCYVLAATEKQCDFVISHPRDMLPSYEGTLLCFDPRGMISWRHRYPSGQFWTDKHGRHCLGNAG